MSLGITATNMANIGYNSYVVANSANGKKYATSESDMTKKYYGISNLSNGLTSLDFSANNDGITTVDAYAKTHYLTSQTSVYDSASDSVDFSTLSGTASSYAKTAYAEQKKGLYSSSSAINLYSIINASSAAKSDYQTAALNSKYSSSSSAISTYSKYISSSTYSSGSLLSTVA